MIANIVAHAVFAFGCLISVANFYYSFVRYPLFRIHGGVSDEYKWISPVPMVGSLFIVIAIPFLNTFRWISWIGVTCAIFDTGGIHWFIVVMTYMTFTDKNKDDE